MMIGLAFQKSGNEKVLAAGSGNMNGYAWSSNIGWINTNNTVTNNYKVSISNTDGTFSGYAWSDGIGWIDFAPVGTYPDGTTNLTNGAKINLTTGVVTGWARIESLKNYVPSSDGWINLKGSNGNYGLVFNLTTGYIQGDLNNLSNPNRWAYSDEIGWIDFNRVQLQGVAALSSGGFGISNISIYSPPGVPAVVIAPTKVGSNTNGGETWQAGMAGASPARIGYKLDMNNTLKDANGNPITSGVTYVWTWKNTTLTNPPINTISNSASTLTGWAIPTSGTIQVSVTATNAGKSFTNTINIYVPKIGQLQ